MCSWGWAIVPAVLALSVLTGCEVFYRADGTKVKVLAAEYGVSVATIESVIYGKSYVEQRLP